MKKLTKGGLVLLIAFLGYACNSESSSKTSVETAEESNKATQKNDMSGAAEDQHKATSEFMVKAASGGLMEVALGKLAQQQSQNDAVKIYGKQMETDHGQINNQLKLLGTAKNIVVPAAPSDEHQKPINELADLKGADFDKKYIDMMVNDHQKDIKLFEEAANNNKLDAEVKALAQKSLPTLRQHLEMAQKSQNEIK